MKGFVTVILFFLFALAFAGTEYVDAVPINELTISIFRETRPEKMFLTLQKYGHKIEEKYPGICQTMRKRRYRRISEERGRNEYAA